MILVFDLFETLVEDLTMDFNLGLKPLWEAHYKDKCTFDEIKAYGEELFLHMLDLHKQGLEFPFVKDELPMYAARFGGEPVNMSTEEEAEFLMRCNSVRAYDGLDGMLSKLEKMNIPMYVLSNSGFTAGALRILLDSQGIAIRAGHHCAQPILRHYGLEGSVRPVLAFYNTPEEIDLLVAALKRLN